MTFDFDFANWLLGLLARLSASAAKFAGGGPGEISALLGYGDGRHATILASGMMPRAHPFTTGFRALFEGALFELHNVFADGAPQSKFMISNNKSGPRNVAVRGRNPHQVELQRFVDCIRGEADPDFLDVERAIEALAVSIATRRSLEETRSVEIRTVLI